MPINYDWRNMDIYLSVHDMREVLRSYGISVETEDKRNMDGKNEVHFWMYKNKRTLRRILYEYDLGGIENIQKHRRYFLKEIIEAFETAEKADVARVHIMGICEMLAKLDDRGFKAKSDYDPGKKVYKIWVGKGDWHCVREVEWCDVLDNDQATVANHARHRQDILESIFKAYKEYETKRALNSLYGTRPVDLESQYVWVTTAGCKPSTVFEEFVKKRIKEKEKDMKNNECTLPKKLYEKAKDDFAEYCALDVAMTKALYQKTNSHKLPEIKKVIFNNPATIVIWADDTKTIVKAQNNELYDPEKGLAMAITKKALGNEGNYFDTIKKWVGDNKSESEAKICRLKTDKRLACVDLQYVLKDKKATKADLIAAMQRAIHYLEREQENES